MAEPCLLSIHTDSEALDPTPHDPTLQLGGLEVEGDEVIILEHVSEIIHLEPLDDLEWDGVAISYYLR